MRPDPDSTCDSIVSFPVTSSVLLLVCTSGSAIDMLDTRPAAQAHAIGSGWQSPVRWSSTRYKLRHLQCPLPHAADCSFSTSHVCRGWQARAPDHVLCASRASCACHWHLCCRHRACPAPRRRTRSCKRGRSCCASAHMEGASLVEIIVRERTCVYVKGEQQGSQQRRTGSR